MITAPSTTVDRIAAIRRRIEEACSNAGRSTSDVELLAVSKTQSAEAVRAAFAAGLCSFGENYALEFVEKRAELVDTPGIDWHFIGHMQTNKVRFVVGKSSLIESIDSVRVADRVSLVAKSMGIVQAVLIEVRADDDSAKTGLPFDRIDEICQHICRLDGVALKGLMGIAPVSKAGDAERSRRYFGRLRAAFERLPLENRQVLSMGMSSDFPAAIAEGSTAIRLGTALFGPRSHSKISE